MKTVTETTRRLTRQSRWLRLSGLLMIVLAFGIFLFVTRQQEELISQQQELVTQKDSQVSVIKVRKNELEKAQRRKRDLELIAREYMGVRNRHQADSLAKFYADTLRAYYINLRDVPKAKVTIEEKRYWKKFPEDVFRVVEPIQAVADTANLKVYINGQQCRDGKACRDEYIVLDFGADLKIKSVTAYFKQ